MIGDDVNTIGAGLLTLNIETDTSIQGVLDCLYLNLPNFTKCKDKPKNEKGLTQQLILFLNRKTKLVYPFFFHKDDMEDNHNGNSPSVDLGVYKDDEEPIVVNDRQFDENESFFKIEAKRLGKLKKEREQEYVVGRFEGKKYIDSGGIERFKKGIHGKKAIHSAIIGYVQLHDFNHWFNAVNGWITDLSKTKSEFWSGHELLENERSSSELSTYISYHLREQKGVKDEIKLHHFWIDLQ